MKIKNTAPWLIAAAICATSAVGADWPQWGGRDHRNMVSTETGLPSTFSPGVRNKDNSGVDMATTRNVKWVAKLGKEFTQ